MDWLKTALRGAPSFVTAFLLGAGFGFLANSRGCAGSSGPEFGVSIPPPSVSGPSPVYEIPRDLPREVLTVTVYDTIRAGDEVGDVKSHEITLYLPQERGQEPLISQRGTMYPVFRRSSVSGSFSELSLDLFVGVSASVKLDASPWAGARIFRILDRLSLGAGADFHSLGPFGSYEVAPRLHLGLMYPVLKYGESTGIRILAAYEF